MFSVIRGGGNIDLHRPRSVRHVVIPYKPHSRGNLSPVICYYLQKTAIKIIKISFLFHMVSCIQNWNIYVNGALNILRKSNLWT